MSCAEAIIAEVRQCHMKTDRKIIRAAPDFSFEKFTFQYTLCVSKPSRHYGRWSSVFHFQRRWNDGNRRCVQSSAITCLGYGKTAGRQISLIEAVSHSPTHLILTNKYKLFFSKKKKREKEGKKERRNQRNENRIINASQRAHFEPALKNWFFGFCLHTREKTSETHREEVEVEEEEEQTMMIYLILSRLGVSSRSCHRRH